jgi:hypothetical protein
MTTVTSQGSPSAKSQTATPSKEVWQKGLIAALVAIIINLVLFVVGSLSGGLAAYMGSPDTTAPMPVPWLGVIIMTIIPVLIGTAVYWLLHRIIPTQAPLVFIIGAALFTILSLGGSIIGGEDMADKVILSLMHIVAGGSLIWFESR